MFKPSLPVALVVALSVGGWSVRADTLETPGRIDEVTVYRGQALVSRLVETPAVAGLHEIVVTELPDQIVPGSLHAESTDGDPTLDGPRRGDDLTIGHRVRTMGGRIGASRTARSRVE